MTDKKLPQESWESFTERRIREAQMDGAFDHLPGFGEPLAGIDDPYDENWWIRDKLRREEILVLPPILEARLERERTLEDLPNISSEQQLQKRLEALNEKIRQAHFSHLAGPADGVLPVDIESTVSDWQQQRGQQESSHA